MKITHSFKIDNKELYVLDDIFSKSNIRILEKYLNEEPHFRKMTDHDRVTHLPRYGTGELNNIKTKYAEFYSRCSKTLWDLFSSEHFRLLRAYCNSIVYGDAAFIHEDCPRKCNDVTALIFANSKWNKEWAGELIFFDRKSNAVHAVSPKPGRMVIFRGAISHRAGIPGKQCNDARLSLVFKFGAMKPLSGKPS